MGNDGLIKLVADAVRGVLVGATAAGAVPAARSSACWRSRSTPRCRSRRIRRMHFAYPTFHRAIEAALDDLDHGRDGRG